MISTMSDMETSVQLEAPLVSPSGWSDEGLSLGPDIHRHGLTSGRACHPYGQTSTLHGIPTP